MGSRAAGSGGRDRCSRLLRASGGPAYSEDHRPLEPTGTPRTLTGFLENDAGNPTYKGFKYLLQVVEELNVSPALVSYVSTEVAGQLRGMPQGAIFNSWVEAQIGGMMGHLRERSREEAERKRDLWQ